MRFFTQDSQQEQNFSLVYRAEDYSFDVEPLDGTGDSSIMINDLQLEIDHEGKIMYVWGFCPLIEYQKTDQVPVEYKTCTLVALLDKPPTLDISYRLNENNRWPIYINKGKGWVCIGNPTIQGRNLIEFSPNCVATMDREELIAVWLHPKDLPNLER